MLRLTTISFVSFALLQCSYAQTKNIQEARSLGRYQEIYDLCLEDAHELQAINEKKKEYCTCVASRANYDSVLIDMADTKDADALVRRFVILGKDCARELGILSKLEKEKFQKHTFQLEKTKGKGAVIDFCLQRIESGKDDEHVYNTLGWNYLLTKEFLKAHYYLEKGAQKFPANLYIQGNYAHSLLLIGQFDSALSIYKKYLNENLEEKLSWRQANLDDIAVFRQLGIVNEHYEEIERLMRN